MNGLTPVEIYARQKKRHNNMCGVLHGLHDNGSEVIAQVHPIEGLAAVGVAALRHVIERAV